MSRSSGSSLFPSLFIMAGLVIAGYLTGQGIQKFRISDRYVTVKGLSERNVLADFAILPLRLTVTADSLSKALQTIEHDRKEVINFLLKNNLERKEIEIHSLQVTDLLADRYNKNSLGKPRYIITASLTVATNKVKVVREISEKSGELVKLGIILTDSRGASYYFHQIHSVKPDMIAEATANARKAAEKFANDSGSRVGSIKRASQGTLVIRDANSDYSSNESMHKKLRIVSTIVYHLE